MIKRLFRRTSFTVRRPGDLGRLAWRIMLFWKVPRIELRIDGLPLLEGQRSQLRLRHLHEVLERKTGGLVAIAVLIIGLADMVRTWNRSMEHMGLVLGVALLAGLAGRILGRVFVRLRFLLELLRIRWRLAKHARRGAIESPVAAPVPAATLHPLRLDDAAAGEPASAAEQENPLHGSCACGAVTFTLSRRPALMGTCHCARCRKSGASATVFAKRKALTLISGAEAIVMREPQTSDHRVRSFCSGCGTALGELLTGSEEFPIPAHLFDDDPGTRNRFHEFVSEKPAWLPICDEAKQFDHQRPV